MAASVASAAALMEKVNSTSITRDTVIQAARLPIRSAMNAVNNASTRYSAKCDEQDAAAGGAERLQDHGLLDATPLGSGQRAGQDQGARQQGDAAGRPDGQPSRD